MSIAGLAGAATYTHGARAAGTGVVRVVKGKAGILGEAA